MGFEITVSGSKNDKVFLGQKAAAAGAAVTSFHPRDCRCRPAYVLAQETVPKISQNMANFSYLSKYIDKYATVWFPSMNPRLFGESILLIFSGSTVRF